ncbi:MAG: (Fe-S)-binding protein [Desulfobulbales bacterium]|nr:(Fe-S)-binding protein [Desulfobulbales bacterium]
MQNPHDKEETGGSHNSKVFAGVLRAMSEECIECNICVKKCAFLQKYGTPKKIADNSNARDIHSLTMAFSCSLCSLCTAVCPVGIDPKEMFLEMRRCAAASGSNDFKRQRQLLKYEERGTSQRYTFYGLPGGCDTVLFPGCALAGSRPQRVMQLYDFLLDYYANLGIILDCCTKPSHDLGRTAYFNSMFSELRQYLVSHGIKNVLLACPSCHAVFKQYGGSLNARMVYDIMAGEVSPPVTKIPAQPVTVQDSCVARFATDMQKSVRRLIRARGLFHEEMRHHGKKTLCCGEGGGAHFISPELAGSWARLRRKDVKNRRVITYCAGCANFLSKVAPTAHVLDLFFDPAPAMAGRVRVAKPPFTYINRMMLKWKFKRKMKYGFSRERTDACKMQ